MDRRINSDRDFMTKLQNPLIFFLIKCSKFIKKNVQTDKVSGTLIFQGHKNMKRSFSSTFKGKMTNFKADWKIKHFSTQHSNSSTFQCLWEPWYKLDIWYWHWVNNDHIGWFYSHFYDTFFHSFSWDIFSFHLNEPIYRWSTYQHFQRKCTYWADVAHGLFTMKVNSSLPSATYMRQWTGSALVQIMACCLIGAKPLSPPMLEYC